MTVLKPFLPFDPSETPVSFATRLASMHIGSGVVPFLRDIGIKPDALTGGAPDAVERLADLAGVDRNGLLRNSATRVAKRRFDLRGNLLTSEFFSSPYTVFCPKCLRQDDAGANEVAMSRLGRLEWTLRPVRTCPRHDLALARRKRQRWDDQVNELARLPPEHGEALDHLIDDAERRTVSRLQDYLLGRLDGQSRQGWLDAQPMEQAIRGTELLGMRVRFGPSRKLAEMTPDDWDAAGRAGYEITSRGEPAIRDALDQMLTETSGKGGKPGCQKIFGSFYTSLSSNKNRKDAGDIARILREHIFETMDVAAGQTVLGVKLAERRLHSVQSLAKECDLDPRTLRNVLAARGLIPVEEKVSAHHVFDAEAGRAVASSVGKLTHVSKLGLALGCTRPQADQLLDERLLLPISDRPGKAAGRARKGVDHFQSEAFLDAVGSNARPVENIPQGMVPISKAAEKTRLLSVEIVHLVLGGFLENIAWLRCHQGYSAILVDPSEVRTRSREVLVGLSATAAFGRLQIPKSVGWALATREDAPRLDALVIEGRKGAHRIHRFSEDTIEDFMSEFATDSRLATECETQKRLMIRHFQRMGVRPILGYAEVGLNLYRIADVPESLSV